MTLYDLSTYLKKILAWRHQIHQHPEIAYEEFKTSELIAQVLEEANIEVHRGIAVTGVVGVLTRGNSKQKIALRADMDALHIQELNDVHYRSVEPGKMHACGHDGHTAMLLGAACYLAANQCFDGTIYFIFQPAEENEGGGKRMVAEGLFDRFPADQVFGMHNMPGLDQQSFAICPGPMMAAFSTFECTVRGRGTHSSMPESGVDPIAPAMAIVQAWHELHSTEFNGDEKVVLSTTKFHAGDTWNVIPDTAVVGGSTRCFSSATANKLEASMKKIAHSLCESFGADYEFEYKRLYPPLVNDAAAAKFAADTAATLVGSANVNRELTPLAGSEDFAYMLEEVPGAYILIGNGGSGPGACMVHNSHYDFNDNILELGASYWIALVERYLPMGRPQ